MNTKDFIKHKEINIFFRTKPIWILTKFSQTQPTILSKLIATEKTIGFVHAHNLIKKCIVYGYIKRGNKQGNAKPLYLTEKGQKLVDFFNNFFEV